MTGAPIVPCQPFGTKFVSGSVTGLTAQEFGQVSLGGGLVIASAAVPTLTTTTVREGVHDLVGYRFAFPDVTTDRVIIRRDHNIANGGSFGTLNFASAEAAATVPTTLELTGLLANDQITMATAYLTGPECDVSLLKSWFTLPTPADPDRHHKSSGVPIRVDAYYLRHAHCRPDDDRVLRLGGSAATITMRDFSTVAGWDALPPATSIATTWSVTATERNSATQCAENGFLRRVRATGSIN